MQGAERANRLVPDARYIWFTDADIEHDSGILRDLVSKAETGNLDLVSTMVRLHCTSPWERLLIPAFIFFFQKLYPFRLVNDPRRRIAAAAGGSMLVRAPSLRGAGGLTAIRGELIDDCALARLIKKNGPIWLGLTGRSRCIRRYGLADIWRMVARSAYTQLRHSPIQLAATSAVMMLLYFVPVAALAWGCASSHYACALAGGATWILMASVYRPMMRLYGQASLASLFLPAAAFLFTIMTLDSARRHWQGKGGMWKGRARP
jgi:hopene-associated glycosyltransferase HpnB